MAAEESQLNRGDQSALPCEHCGSDNVFFEYVEDIESVEYLEYTCQDCGRSWTEVDDNAA